MKETELAKQIIPWLEEQHWEVYQEIPCRGGAIDILAVKDNISWAIEVKTTFGLTVLDQARSRRTLYRSIFVPSPKSGTDKWKYHLARKYFRVGVIEFSKYGYVREQVPAPLIREYKQTSDSILSKLTEAHKTYCKAGSKSGQRLTPFRQTMDKVKVYIGKNPGCEIKDIFLELGKSHYKTEQSFKQSVLQALCTFEKWCEVDKTSGSYKFSVKENHNEL